MLAGALHGFAVLASAGASGGLGAAQAAHNEAVREALSDLGVSQIFTLLFMSLGPLKTLVPFVSATQGADAALRRRIAFTAFGTSTVALFAAMLIGQSVLARWQVSLPALILTAGTLLFYVSFQSLVSLYRPHPPDHEQRPLPSLRTAVSPIAFPAIATPYGIAILIVLKVVLPDNPMELITALSAIMLLNLAAMLFAQPILRVAGTALQVVSTVLMVMQAALGMQLLLAGLRVVI
jgi:multiple antibiotic resistance protein